MTEPTDRELLVTILQNQALLARATYYALNDREANRACLDIVTRTNELLKRTRLPIEVE